MAVDASGVLADKVVIALASGSYHNLALCSDGSVAAWGYNNYGQLGDGTKVTARMPVLVNTGGILAGKQVVAVAAGAYQSYALSRLPPGATTMKANSAMAEKPAAWCRWRWM